ncbi:hypothetical protein [Candidatus Stoquefichus sp. SB1]|uniref:hypothetical protein n=1 Tax=Candidatus Stoquefichus sp. SB1 TaxID=1658109 RepID=UPI00067EA3E8|nr:hypothetical protein [Candidatus Stoquefichus sp. SB1]
MVKVYRMNDFSFVASDLSVEETNAWYEKEFDDVNDIEDIREVDLDSEGMWWLLTDENRIHEFLNECIEETMTETKFGSLMTRNYNEVFEFISYREALKRSGEYTEPYEIASTEF